MTSQQYNELMFAIDSGSRTVSNQEILAAVGYLDEERLRLQYVVLGQPYVGASFPIVIMNPTEPTP